MCVAFYLQKILLAIECYVKKILADTRLSEPEEMKIVIQKLSQAMNNIEFLTGKIDYFVEVEAIFDLILAIFLAAIFHFSGVHNVRKTQKPSDN